MPTYNVFKKNKEEVIKGKDLKEALKKVPDLYFDRYSLPVGDKIPSKICYRKNEDRQIGNVAYLILGGWNKGGNPRNKRFSRV